jgi:hypothetical protein
MSIKNLAIFVLKKWALAKKKWVLFLCRGKIIAFWSKKVGFWPFLQTKSGQNIPRHKNQKMPKIANF